MTIGLRTCGRIDRIMHSVDHDHQCGVLLENVVCEWDDHDDCRWRRIERQPGKSLDEGSQQIGRKHAVRSEAV